MFRRLILSVAAIAALMLAPAVAQAQTLTTSPATTCTRAMVAGVRSCSLTLTWDKGASASLFYSLWYSASDQKTGWINAPYPGLIWGCNTTGTGSLTMNLPRTGVYRFGLWGSSLPCAYQISGSIDHPALPLIPLAEAYVVVN